MLAANAMTYTPVFMKHEKSIEFGALRTFATVAESQTLAHAAQRLGITQSAVSQAIKQLETLVDADLVVRRSRPIRLTQAGETLREHADRILADTRKLMAAVEMASGKGLRQLNIGLVDSFAEVAGVALMHQARRHADKIAMRSGLVTPLTEEFLERKLDLLITSDAMLTRPGLERHPLLRDPFVMLIPERMCHDNVPTLEALAEKVPYIRYNRRSQVGMAADIILRRLHVQPTSMYELDGSAMLIRLVQNGEGWAVSTGLCLLQQPQLLAGVRVVILDQIGASARHMTLVAREQELGEVPALLAQSCRDLYEQNIVPQMRQFVPTLQHHACAVDELPSM